LKLRKAVLIVTLQTMSSSSADLILPSVAKLSHHVWRIMGQNPGPMTLGGTNTYLVGTGQRRLLIDTGEGRPEYLPALQQALKEAAMDADRSVVEISSVVLTHWHHDHVGGLRGVLNLFPNASVFKVPSRCAGADLEINDLPHINPFQSSGSPFELREEGATLEFLPTPGHTDDHIALFLREERAFFTGDCILGGGSSVFACYSDFMNSLEKLRAAEPRILYPGHGPMVTDALKRIDEQVKHREMRESQIFSVVQRSPGSVSIAELVEVVYMEVPMHLHPAACVNALHHLKKLLKDNRVKLDTTSTSRSMDAFAAMGDYDGGEGSQVDVEKMTAVIREVRWSVATSSSL
jgi:glyoxylase-like metal-dependent hydrolase (beta-lactamase superfamily II)